MVAGVVEAGIAVDLQRQLLPGRFEHALKSHARAICRVASAKVGAGDTADQNSTDEMTNDVIRIAPVGQDFAVGKEFFYRFNVALQGCHR